MIFNDFLVFGFIPLCVYLILKVEASSRLGKFTQWVPAILLAYVVPAIVNPLFLWISEDHLIHSLSKKYLLPLTVFCAMASISLTEIKIVAGKPIIYFLLSSAIIAVCPVVLLLVFCLIPDFHEFLIVEKGYTSTLPVVGSWIGGSSSMLVLKELAETPESLFLSVLVLDNVIVNVWTLFLFQWIKKTPQLNQRFGREAVIFNTEVSNKKQKPNRFWSISVIVLVVALSSLFDLSFLFKIILFSLLGMLLANLLRFWDHKMLQKLSKLLIIAVMSVLGLKLNLNYLEFNPRLITFLSAWMVLQFGLSFWLALRMNISLVWVPLASMANVGGVSTAPAVASAYDKRLMPHAIVLAIVSMVTGTFWGLITLQLMKWVIPLA
ncbi:MAG: hypothetical protein DA439_07100 [Bacteroidetes bacterium]|nr:MAG: hypothetical protein DA439_07100 [Bacteroidota bacterium]